MNAPRTLFVLGVLTSYAARGDNSSAPELPDGGPDAPPPALELYDSTTTGLPPQAPGVIELGKG